MAELQRVDIYVETDNKAPASCERYGGYVLEYVRANGEPETRHDFRQTTGTYHGVILETLKTALTRIKRSCEVHIHTQDAYVLNMVDKFLATWAENGFRNSKGEPIKNMDIWEQLWQQVKKHKIVVEHGPHSFHGWMQRQMEEKKKEKTREH